MKEGEIIITILKTKDVASVLETSLPTARKVMLSEGFPLIKVGKNLKVEETAFHEWLQGKRFY